MLFFPDTLYEEFMARNLNLTISSENDGTTRNNVPDILVHMTVSGMTESGEPFTLTVDRYFLAQLNRLLSANQPAFIEFVKHATYRIERVLDPRIADDPGALF